MLAHWAGALIFMLAALLIPRLLEEVRVSDFALVGVVISPQSCRAGGDPLRPSAASDLLKLSPVVERPYRAAILWGGCAAR